MNAPGNHRGNGQPSLAAAQQLFEMQAVADYPRRAAEICTRAGEAWLAACAEGSRACTEATRATVEEMARLGRR